MVDAVEVVEVFLDGAEVVATALADAATARAWDQPSVLEQQQVSSLAGHLARGAVWVVGDYLDAATPTTGVDFGTAGEYFAAAVGAASEDEHRTIRDRGAATASMGHEQLLRTLRDRIEALGPRLRALDPGQLVAVAGGKVMRLDDYLCTRIVEQTVHLDDLARSVSGGPWPVAAQAQIITIAVGAETARLRSGAAATIRALYRRGFAEPTLPVL